MREFPEIWTLRKITHAGNDETATITPSHYIFYVAMPVLVDALHAKIHLT
jgi:hypothetical protein